MDEITIKTSNPKFRLYWCLTEFQAWRHSQSSRYFRPLVNKCRSMQYVTEGGKGKGIGLCGEHIQELYSVYLTTFRTYKVALPPQTINQEGRGPQTDKHLSPSPFTGFTGQFLRKADIQDWNILLFCPCLRSSGLAGKNIC